MDFFRLIFASRRSIRRHRRPDVLPSQAGRAASAYPIQPDGAALTAGTIHQTETARHAASLDGVIIRTSAGDLDGIPGTASAILLISSQHHHDAAASEILQMATA